MTSKTSLPVLLVLLLTTLPLQLAAQRNYVFTEVPTFGGPSTSAIKPVQRTTC